MADAARANGPGFGATLRASVGFSAGNVDVLELRGEALVQFLTQHDADPGDTEGAPFRFRDRVLLAGSYSRKAFVDTLTL